FPEQLRQFFREIGYAFFRASDRSAPNVSVNYINRFLAPSQIADLLLGADQEIAPSEGFDDGEIPFFEVGDQLYLVLRSSDALPAQVAWPIGDRIADDLIEFTKRLAANPRFYHD